MLIRKLFKLIIPLAAVGGLAVWGYFAIKNHEININSFFVGDMTRGVDVSSYQEDVNMSELKNQNIEFIYIKATEGSSHQDPSFATKWQAAKDADLPAGAYHYFSYGSSGAAQAENFISTVGDLDGHLIPVVDMELTLDEVMDPPAKDAVVKGLKAFAAVIEEHYGVRPIIYSRQDYFQKYLADDFADYQRWVTNFFWPVWLDTGDNWLVWQYNDCGHLSGYKGEECIDLNALHKGKTIDDLRIK